ncbi:unnamed protein product [Caenorhabditis brenneri]
MWIQKVIILLFLCFESNRSQDIESFRFERAENEPDLLLVYKDLAKLSRILNAISIQSSAIRKNIKVRDVITELLNVNTVSFSTVVKNNLTSFLPILEDLEKRSSTLVRNMDTKRKQMLFKTRELSDNLKNIAGQYVLIDEIQPTDPFFNHVLDKNIVKTMEACDAETVTLINNMYGILTTKSTSLNEGKHLKTISDAKSKVLNINKCMQNFRDYKKKVKDVFEVLQYPFFQLAMKLNLTKAYSEESESFKNFETYIQAAKDELLKTQNEMRGFSSNKVGEMLKRGLNHLKTISDPKKSSPRLLTVAFNHTKDLLDVRKDLKSDWFKEKVSKGKNSSELEKNLHDFFEFGKMMTTLEESWLEFLKQFSKSRKDLEITIEKADISENHESTGQDIFDNYYKKFKSCYKTTNYDKGHYQEYSNFKSLIKKMNGKVSKITKWTEDISSTIDPDPLKTFLGLFNSSKEESTLAETLPKIKVLNGYKTFEEFSSRFGDLEKAQKELKAVFPVKEISEAKAKMSDILKTFDSSVIGDISKCLTTGDPLDSDKVISAIDYTMSVLETGHFHSTIELFRQFLKMRNDLMVVEEHVKEMGTKYHVDKNNPVLKLEDPQEISLSFGRGVEVIHDMAKALQDQKLLLEATNYHAGVVQSIRQSNRNEFVKDFFLNPSERIQTLLKELRNLDKRAKTTKDQDLLKVKEIFIAAMKVNGFPEVFSHVYNQLVDYKFQENEKIRNVHNSKRLSKLDLDFSAHKGYLTAASISVGNIKSYFDDVFGLNSKTTKRKTWQNAYGLVVGISISVFFVALILILTLYGFTEGGRRKYKKWYLYYYPRKDEFEKRWRYSLFMDRVEGKNALLEAVREISAPNVLKAVKRGAFIDAFNKNGNTALHVATKRGYPEIVEILIKNGADRSLLNVQNKTPEQMIPPEYRETHKEKIQRFEKVEKIYKKYQKKKFRLQVPDVFPNSSFHIYVEGRTNDVLTNSFTEKFQSITSEEILPTTTHCIVKTERDGHLETNDLKLVLWIFFGVIMVKDTWMIDCLKDEDLIDRDFDYLIENIKYNGVMYSTVTQWTKAMAKGEIPYLHGVYVAVVIMGYENMALLSTIVTTHGGVMLDKFPEKDAYNIGSRPYLHADTPPLIIIHDGTVCLKSLLQNN